MVAVQPFSGHLVKPTHVAEVLHRHKGDSAFVIFEAIKEDVLAFAEPEDDISFVVIKRD